jgi:hypothetical protein
MSGEKRDTPTLLGSLERTNLSRWAMDKAIPELLRASRCSSETVASRARILLNTGSVAEWGTEVAFSAACSAGKCVYTNCDTTASGPRNVWLIPSSILLCPILATLFTLDGHWVRVLVKLFALSHKEMTTRCISSELFSNSRGKCIVAYIAYCPMYGVSGLNCLRLVRYASLALHLSVRSRNFVKRNI